MSSHNPPLVTAENFYDGLAAQYDALLEERAPYLEAVDSFCISALKHAEARDVLDAGCGNGGRLLRIARRASIVHANGIDISPHMVREAQHNGAIANVADLSDTESSFINENQSSYDAVLCLWNVLGHVQNDRRATAIANINKLLRPGGMLIVDVNNRLNAAYYGPGSAVRNAVHAIRYGNEAGDFPTTRQDTAGEPIVTTTHLFSQREITALIENGGFSLEQICHFDYGTGSPRRSQFLGQICLRATKEKTL